MIRPLIAAAAGIAVIQAGPGITGLATVRDAFFPQLSGIGRPDHVALTFDDGPDLFTTPELLDLLAARGVRATFFLLGSQVRSLPRVAAEIVEVGHEVAVHGWDHKYLPLRGPMRTYHDLARTVNVIVLTSGNRVS